MIAKLKERMQDLYGLLNHFKKKKKVHKFVRINNAWGRSIEYHGPHWVMFGQHPQVGDIIVWPMHSGAEGVFEITKVDRPSDPGDLCICDVKEKGYVEGGALEEYEIIEESKGVTFL